MIINELKVTNNIIDIIDNTSCHIELNGCFRLVKLSQTEFNTIEELQIAIEALKF